MAEIAEKRRVVLGITGSIAAYKAAELARLLVSRGYEVRVVMTEAATRFVTAMTMQSVTGHKVMTDFWTEDREEGIGHIELADWAEVLVIAPASADSLAKLNAGFADNALLAVALATKAPILVAPAMNVNMYENPRTQQNLASLRSSGVEIVDPEVGALACGWSGSGRLASPNEIFFHIRRVLSGNDFKGKKILLTTGPTREPIDPVRFLSNRSSGKMGAAIATEAFRRGAEVAMIHGPVKIKVPASVRRVPVVTAKEMSDAVLREMDSFRPDIVIMAAAVSDYRPKVAADHKIKKSGGLAAIELLANPDILAELGAKRKGSSAPLLVGFAVETGEMEDLLTELRRKLNDKNADLMVGNLATDAFDLDTNRVWLIDRSGREEQVATTYKSRVAAKIMDAVRRLC